MAIPLKWYYISLIIVVLDQISKVIARKYLPYITNTGSLFGLFSNSNIIFIIFTILIIVLIIFNLVKQKLKRFEIIFLSLVLGGAFGNLIDRIIYGAVTDFIDLKIWPVFNLADVAISIGVIGLIVYYLKK